MNYRIEARSNKRIRIRLYKGKLTKEEVEILKYAFAAIPGVNKVTIYSATGGVALEHDGPVAGILERLDRFRFENVEMLAREEDIRISVMEMKNRKLDQELKRKLRLRILAETVADIAMPVPVQIGYHVWQMITLRDM